MFSFSAKAIPVNAVLIEFSMNFNAADINNGCFLYVNNV